MPHVGSGVVLLVVIFSGAQPLVFETVNAGTTGLVMQIVFVDVSMPQLKPAAFNFMVYVPAVVNWTPNMFEPQVEFAFEGGLFPNCPDVRTQPLAGVIIQLILVKALQLPAET